ncbi:DNA-damage-inducible SOS response protein [Escherichia coli]|uniref:DNA-damage-inducible SOS response protein n=1 Tax=Escherichia coli TaxID=562 RepID=A0A377DZ75_ECOLX|nr:DNA-damage-inducible SOS response protein [Escherichia coli]
MPPKCRNSMAVAAAGFALTLLTLPWLGNHALWLALTVFLALRGLSLAAIWRRHWRNGTLVCRNVTVKNSE